jgi:hypothetical protein
MAWRVAGNEHAYGTGTAIDCLMRSAGSDLEAFTGVKDEVVTVNFKGQFSFEDKEELPRMEVVVTSFAGAGRHELFDDAEAWGLDEVPAVAGSSLRTSPPVVFSGFCADGLCLHRVDLG